MLFLFFATINAAKVLKIWHIYLKISLNFLKDPQNPY